MKYILYINWTQFELNPLMKYLTKYDIIREC